MSDQKKEKIIIQTVEEICFSLNKSLNALQELPEFKSGLSCTEASSQVMYIIYESILYQLKNIASLHQISNENEVVNYHLLLLSKVLSETSKKGH